MTHSEFFYYLFKKFRFWVAVLVAISLAVLFSCAIRFVRLEINPLPANPQGLPA